jgi:recombination protein RecA
VSELDKLISKYGKFIKKPGEEYDRTYDYISTGSLALDLAIGKRGVLQGIPRGLITTIWGHEGAGKTTLAASCMSRAQEFGKVALINAEPKMDFDYLERMGIDIDSLTIVDQDYSLGVYGEQATQAMIEIAKTGEYSMIVCDSITGLTPKKTAMSEMNESNPGVHAAMVSRLLGKIIPEIKSHNTALIFTSQRRSTFNSGWGAKQHQITGGNALKFNTALKIKLYRSGYIKESGENVGIKSTAILEKNFGPPNVQAEFYITEDGLDRFAEIVNIGKEVGVVYNNASWYYYGDPETGEEKQIGQGESKAIDFMKENSEIADKLVEIIRERMSDDD